jgi:hypothetical protein
MRQLLLAPILFFHRRQLKAQRVDPDHLELRAVVGDNQFTEFKRAWIKGETTEGGFNLLHKASKVSGAGGSIPAGTRHEVES